MLKKYRLILTLTFLGILVFGYFYKNSIQNSCSETYRKDMTIQAGKAKIDVEVTKTEADQEKGLGGRACIGNSQGMLFTFDKADHYQFWMKDMKFPIDFVWLDSSKKIIQINQNVSPATYPQNFTTATPSRYVLELKAGESQKLVLHQNTQFSF